MNKTQQENREYEALDVKQRASRVKFIMRLMERPTQSAGGLFEAFLFSCGSSSILYRNMTYGRYIDWKKEKKKDDSYRQRQNYLRLRNRYHSFISELRRDGILSPQKQITERARKYVKGLIAKTKKEYPAAQFYEKKKTKLVILVTYDIPEKMANKRNWMRRVVQSLGFEKLQKSVWIGNTEIPEQLMHDLKELKLLDFVQIASISRTGTIRVL